MTLSNIILSIFATQVLCMIAGINHMAHHITPTEEIKFYLLTVSVALGGAIFYSWSRYIEMKFGDIHE